MTEEKKPHKHAELIKAWADGAIIQIQITETNRWIDDNYPTWNAGAIYRIKSEPKPDIVIINGIAKSNNIKGDPYLIGDNVNGIKVKFIFDGKTELLKSVELLKDNNE